MEKKTVKKNAKDAQIPFQSKDLEQAAVKSVMKVSKYNQNAARLLLSKPTTVGALIGLALAAGVGKYAYKKNKSKTAEDLLPPATTSGNYLVELGGGVVDTIRRYSVNSESGILKNLKNLVMKNPKTAALIAGTAIVSAGMSLRDKKKKK